MVATIVLNSNNIVNDGNNNTLIYNFPNTVNFPHHEIAVQSINMFYSWVNISAALGNNKFTIYFPINSNGISGGGTALNATVLITIPDGLYEISDLNNLIQFYCIKNGFYLINAAGQYVYYLELIVNPTLYSIQVNCYPFPTSSGWTYNGSNQWTGNVGTAYAGWTTPLANITVGYLAFQGFPSATQTYSPQIYFPQGFNNIVGYPAGTYPSNSATTTVISYQSSTAPQIQPNSSIYFAISNIQNKYSVPSSIIYAISPSVALGAEITDYPPQFAYNKLLEGNYNQLRLNILGSNYQPLKILDPNMTILLVIRDTREIATADLISKLEGGKG